MKAKQIKWKSIRVLVSCIDPTPTNYKIKTELGKARLAISLNKFGLAGNAVCNPGAKKGRYDLIDGNSRWEEAKERKDSHMWISIPDRRLTSKEYKEMSAMFDVAKAGDIDMKRIQEDLGTSEDFYDLWKLAMPLDVLDKLGAKAKDRKLSELEYPEQKGKNGKVIPQEDICMVNLFFSIKQEEEFRKIEEKLMKKFKTEKTSDTVLKAFKYISK